MCDLPLHQNPKTQEARRAPPHKLRTIQLLCSSYLTAKVLVRFTCFSMRNLEVITTWLGCMLTTTDHSCTSKEDRAFLRDLPQELRPPMDQPCSPVQEGKLIALQLERVNQFPDTHMGQLSKNGRINSTLRISRRG
ncbi:hypothetical protein EV1_039966 [Malus domestica]